MSDNVKSFLLGIYNSGNKTGRKTNAKEVASIMKHKVDENGKLVFQPDEWRSEKQIASFFSRMASIQRIRNREEVTSEGTEAYEADVDICEALIRDQEMYEIRKAVYEQIDYQHPLMFEGKNLCSLAKTNSIGKLKLRHLKDICEHFSIDVSGPKTRKDTFVNLLLDFILACKCA